MQSIKVLRIDDLGLLYAQVKELGIQHIIDEVVTIHGNWQGLSLGHLLSIWLCYLLSESDHRLSSVEAWVLENELLLKTLSGQMDLRSKDFTDDRLEQALDYLSKESNWLQISDSISAKSLEIYDLDADKTIRLDAAPMQGHKEVKVSKLFQYGYSKHHNPKLGMLKIMLACIDNEVNGFGYPLAHLTVSGEKADDGLYIPIIEQCERIFATHPIRARKLYVGDSKMGSKENRWYIRESENDYLVPLSKIQLSDKERSVKINEVSLSDYNQVYTEDKSGEMRVVAQGFEYNTEESYIDQNGKERKWLERRIFVRSAAYATAQEKALDKKIKETSILLKNLLVHKQGKQVPKTKEELEEKVAELISAKGLNGLLTVVITQHQHSKTIRAYKDRPAREEHWTTFELAINENELAINERKKMQGWQVYATTLSQEKLSFEKIVWKYRYQNRIESRFNDLRNKVVPLVPIFLKKDNRVEALINLLMICLKICAIMEFKVAKKLKEQKKQLDNIYEGNPKRSTATPTARRLLRQFQGISIVILKQTSSDIPDIILTDLKQIHLSIIDLLGFKPTIYTDLARQMKLFFPN